MLNYHYDLAPGITGSTYIPAQADEDIGLTQILPQGEIISSAEDEPKKENTVSTH